MQPQLIAETAYGSRRDALAISFKQPLLGAKRHHYGFETESRERFGLPALQFFD